MTQDEVIRLIDASPLKHFGKTLQEYLAPSIRLRTRRASSEDLPLGTSRFGGTPDWPEGTCWPTLDGEPLAFLAQISLQELRRFDPEVTSNGWLYFFYEAVRQEGWGFDSKHRNCWRVLHIECPLDDLYRQNDTKLPEEARFHLCAVDMELEYVLPPTSLLHVILERDPTQEEASDYYDILAALNPEDSTLHRLFGYENQVQGGDMREQCQLASNGVYCGGVSWLDDPRAAELLEENATWLLLLQIDSDEAGPGWMWGDCGRIYYWLKESDYDKGAVDQAWLILECY